MIEPAAGATRTMMAFLLAAYDEEEVRGEVRTVLRLHPRLAPYKVAVLPLSKKDTLTPKAREVLALLQPHLMCDYDETQAIGRRYRRQDELGTPFCVTVDFDTPRRRRRHRARSRLDGPGARGDRRPARPPPPQAGLSPAVAVRSAAGHREGSGIDQFPPLRSEFARRHSGAVSATDRGPERIR